MMRSIQRAEMGLICRHLCSGKSDQRASNQKNKTEENHLQGDYNQPSRRWLAVVVSALLHNFQMKSLIRNSAVFCIRTKQW